MPQGVMSANSRLTIMIPLDMGRIAEIHSKHPQLVMGSVIMEYALICPTLPWELDLMNSFTFSHCPNFPSTVAPF